MTTHPTLPKKTNNLTGKRYGRLKVLYYVGKNKHRKATWRCRCKCGNEVTVVGSSLVSGNTNSCNCYFFDKITTHGQSYRVGSNGSAEYNSWTNMVNRCRNKNQKDYRYYGGKGVKVCERWKLFENFLEDMGPKPTPKHTIDRYPDPAGNYEPTNCRWATKNQQDNNKTNTIANREATYCGRKVTLKELSDLVNIPLQIIYRRWMSGWDGDKIATHPYKPYKTKRVR